MDNRTENQKSNISNNRIHIIDKLLSHSCIIWTLHCHNDIRLICFFVIHAKMVSHKLHGIVYSGQVLIFSFSKKSNTNFLKYAILYSMSLTTTLDKISQNAVEWFRGDALTTYFRITFNFGKISKF